MQLRGNGTGESNRRAPVLPVVLVQQKHTQNKHPPFEASNTHRDVPITYA